MPNSPVAPVQHRRARPLVAVATVLLTAGLLVLPACSGSAAATTFQRQPVNATTPDSFMKSVGTDRAGMVPPAHVAAAAYSAKIPGLYGGSGDNSVCDPAALVGFLSAHADEAKAWAKVLGIDVADIGAYVGRLTPVLLRTDTAVTNHGFKGGVATSIPAVLQAGTAVLVDDRGAPVVKCGCGNPLTAAPSTKDAAFTGVRWDGFAADTVTTVEPAAAPVTTLVIADPSGGGVTRPVGTTGADDTPFDPTTITPAGDPVATTPGGAGTPAGVDPVADPGSPAVDSPTDGDSSAVSPDATTTTTQPDASGVHPYTLDGTSVPGTECFGVPPGPVTVQVSGSGGNRRITLPSAAAPGFDGLVFAVNPDGSVDADVSYSPPGAAGLTVTYRFQGHLTVNDPPTPSTVTGTLTTSGGGVPDCVVQYDASGQTDPTPASSAPAAPTSSVTTYLATYGMAGSVDAPGGTVGAACARARFLDFPFSITIRVREGVDRGEVRVVGMGWPGETGVALGSPAPRGDLRGGVSDRGTFSVGGHVTYDGVYEGAFSADWSGGVGARRTRPAEFPLTIHQKWDRDRDFISWLNGSGGPESFECSFQVTAIRQA